MPYAIECYLDDTASQAVRRLWSLLDGADVPSLGSVAHASHEPHVSLAVFEDADVDAVCDQAQSQLHAFVGLPLTLGHLGFFLTDESPAFLAVRMTDHLSMRHRELWDAIERLVTGAWDHYRPDAFEPHCTLAMAVADRGRVANLIPNGALPLVAQVASVNVVDIHTGVASHRLRS
jgi:hypothetical protein